MPSSTTRAKAPKRRLLARKAPSRDTGESIAPGERSRSPRQASSPIAAGSHDPEEARAAPAPIPVLLNEWTDSSTPERVRNVARMVRLNVAMTSERFQTRSMPRRSWTITECRKAVAVIQGRKAAFSTGSQAQ